jgi:hypothetical protein
MPRKTIVVNLPYIPCFPTFELDFASFKQAIDPLSFPDRLPDFDPLDLF